MNRKYVSEKEKKLISILESLCDSPKLSTDAIEMLVKLGFGVLGYNVMIIPSRRGRR